jgi:DhnA family fructose-bisphosphate aldolase class Ia
MAYGVRQAGAAGLTFGRNIWQSSRPASMIHALGHILHRNGSVSEALEQLGG